jgi:hypothetical protein
LLTPQGTRDTAAEQALAVRLRAWSARSRAKTNLTLAGCAGVSVIWLYAASAGAPDRGALLRHAATLFIVFHGTMHVLWMRMLRRLSARGMPEAQGALAAYTNPRRITNLDLAMFWVMIFALAPHLV